MSWDRWNSGYAWGTGTALLLWGSKPWWECLLLALMAWAMLTLIDKTVDLVKHLLKKGDEYPQVVHVQALRSSLCNQGKHGLCRKANDCRCPCHLSDGPGHRVA